MSNEFWTSHIDRVQAYAQTARDEYGQLEVEALNWKPSADGWSVGQVFDHLVTTNSGYFDIFDAVANGSKQSTFWERLPVFPGIWGKFVHGSVTPDVKRKVPAPKVFEPRQSDVPVSIVQDFIDQQDRLAKCFDAMRDVDPDRVIITSPVASFITYSLRHAVMIVVDHEERHLGQVQRVNEARNA